MPLLKLWNRLFGNSQSTKSAKPNRGTGNGTGTSDGATRKLAKPTTPKQAASTSNENPARLIPAAAPAKRSVLDLVSGGPHASLCRMIKKSGAASVLEVGVGDGTRAIAVLSTLAKSQPDREIKYFAIDLFEMGDGVLTLKTFHQQIRSIDVKPNLDSDAQPTRPDASGPHLWLR